MPLSSAALLLVLHYIERLCAFPSTIHISNFTVHRIMFASACIATKALDDMPRKHKNYAKIGVVSVLQSRFLEVELLERLNWKVLPPADLERKCCEFLAAKSYSNCDLAGDSVNRHSDVRKLSSNIEQALDEVKPENKDITVLQ
jgi:Cyclin